MGWTKTVPTKPGLYLHQDPDAHMETDRRVKCSNFCEYDMRVHPNFPPKGWWYKGPIQGPPVTGEKGSEDKP